MSCNIFITFRSTTICKISKYFSQGVVNRSHLLCRAFHLLWFWLVQVSDLIENNGDDDDDDDYDQSEVHALYTVQVFDLI